LHSAAVCAKASARASIPCTVSQRFARDREDVMMSKEKWVVVQRFLRRRQRVMYAGSDVRFLRPVHSMFAAAGAVDAAFEGRSRGKAIGHFTPDVVIAFPTAGTRRLVHAVLAGIRAPANFDGLPAELRRPALLSHNLHGPAEQDLLVRDLLLTALYNRPVAVRKTMVAAEALKLTLRNDPRKGLGALRVARTPHGAIVNASPHLVLLLTDNRLVVSGPPDLCLGWSRADAWQPAACGWSRAHAHALHCLGKRAHCLNTSRCACAARRSL
jgi:hypothetical protein